MHEQEQHHNHHDHAHGATPMEELVAMLRYMVGHEQVMQAVKEYQQANERLQGVLENLE